nr:unnamed protein product [Callosobruchus chinensis]
MIWHGHVLSLVTAACKKLRYLLRSRKYFSLSNLLVRCPDKPWPCSYTWAAAAHTILSILDAVRRKVSQLLGHLAMTRY